MSTPRRSLRVHDITVRLEFMTGEIMDTAVERVDSVLHVSSDTIEWNVEYFSLLIPPEMQSKELLAKIPNVGSLPCTLAEGIRLKVSEYEGSSSWVTITQRRDARIVRLTAGTWLQWSIVEGAA